MDTRSSAIGAGNNLYCFSGILNLKLKKGGEIIMIDVTQKKGMSPVAAGFVGAAVAAGAAGVAAVMSKPENRKKVGKVLSKIREEGEKILETAVKRGEEMQKDAEKRITKVIEGKSVKGSNGSKRSVRL